MTQLVPPHSGAFLEPAAATPAPPAVLRVERRHHAGGEFVLRPDALIVCVYLGPPRTVEQASDDGQRWRGLIARGDIQVMVPGCARVFRHREPADHAHLTIAGPPLRELAAAAGADAGALRPHLALRDAPLRHLAEALLAEDGDAPTSRLFREAAATAVLARLIALDHGGAGAGDARAAPTRHGLPPAALARVLALLEARLAEDVPVDELARAAGLSPAHFATLFRNSTGEPPHRYQLRLRVERARQLLERGADPTDAALAAGFYDQSHLGRHMRRLLGVTPGAIARARRSPKDRPAARRIVQERR